VLCFVHTYVCSVGVHLCTARPVATLRSLVPAGCLAGHIFPVLVCMLLQVKRCYPDGFDDVDTYLHGAYCSAGVLSVHAAVKATLTADRCTLGEGCIASNKYLSLVLCCNAPASLGVGVPYIRKALVVASYVAPAPMHTYGVFYGMLICSLPLQDP
jgi:hypothetical protein